MHIITIEVKWNMMKVHQGKMKRSRLEWRGPGIEIYVLGSMKGGLYDQAANLAMNYAQGIHVAPSSLRRAFKGAYDRTYDNRLISGSAVDLKKKLF